MSSPPVIRGVALLAGKPQIDLEALFTQIVPNEKARQSHMMAARNFRDFLPMLGRQKVINVSKYDDGNLCLLGHFKGIP